MSPVSHLFEIFNPHITGHKVGQTWLWRCMCRDGVYKGLAVYGPSPIDAYKNWEQVCLRS